MKKSRGQLEAESALEYLHERGVTRFVHFTSLDNLDSILERGLVPRRTLNDEGIDYLANDQLRLDGLDHVNLSITHPNIKFFYKIRKTYPERYYVVLAIRPDVLLHETKCCLGKEPNETTNQLHRDHPIHPLLNPPELALLT